MAEADRSVSRQSYENYGRGAGHADVTVVAGRYAYQTEAERLVAVDVASKLELSPMDDLLEIGCGSGNILIPLSFQCQSATGIDHPGLLERLGERFPGPPTITAVPGNFLDLSPAGYYTKILMYAMLHYLSSTEEVLAFVHKATRLLRPGGRMLLGDLPNADRKRRFLATQAGREFDAEWKERRARAGPPEADLLWEGDPELVGSFDDESVMRIVLDLRRAGFETYILQQPVELPFGHTREDLLVVAGRE